MVTSKLLSCGTSEFFFHSLNNVFHRANYFNFDKVQLIIFFSLKGHIFGDVAKNSLFNLRSKRFSLLFSYANFIALCLLVDL